MRRIFLAGHRGMVGQAIRRKLEARREGGEAIAIVTRDRDGLDLTDQAAVRRFMQDEAPDAVILAAAKVGGIHANNTYPADFIYENLMIECNIIHQAFAAGVRQLLFLGSSCIYPREAAQPMKESALLTGTLEATNEPYAIAKIAGDQAVRKLQPSARHRLPLGHADQPFMARATISIPIIPTFCPP